MSDEDTSQANTEDVQETTDQPKIGEPVEETEEKGPESIDKATEEKTETETDKKT